MKVGASNGSGIIVVECARADLGCIPAESSRVCCQITCILPRRWRAVGKAGICAEIDVNFAIVRHDDAEPWRTAAEAARLIVIARGESRELVEC